jgi:hypothetical protein
MARQKQSKKRSQRQRKRQRERKRGSGYGSLERTPSRIDFWSIEEALNLSPCEVIDHDGNVVQTYDQVPTALAKAGAEAGQVWLWCLHCARFFQAKDLKLDFLGNWQRCPFDDCGAAGFDVDILLWNNGQFDPNWPRSTEELSFGLEYPPPVEKKWVM